MRLFSITLAAALLLSCADDRTPSAPTPVPIVTTPPTFLLSGTIRDDDGRSLSGVQVVAGQLYSKTGPGFSTTTDDNGRYSGRLPNGSHGVYLTKPGFRPLNRDGVVISGDTVFDATLRPGVIISGSVNEPGADMVDGVTIEIVSGPNAGQKTESRLQPFRGRYWFDYLLPGEMRLRASKPGYDTVEQTVTATIDTTVNFSMRMTYGACLRSVGPLFLDAYRAAGGVETITVNANDGRQWTATAEVPWLQVASPATRTGSGQVSVQIAPHPIGAVDTRRGVVMIRCSASEAQAVTFVQKPDCQIRLAATASTPATFPEAGGNGGLTMDVGVPGCLWEARSQVNWMSTVGVSSWRGQPPIPALEFFVRPNETGQPRSGQLLVGETLWTVNQR